MTQTTKIISGSIPKYRQLLMILRNQILRGDFQPGDRIPSEEELTQMYGLSRGTVRKAMSQLEAEKMIEIEHGVGSFVRAFHPNTIPFRFVDSPVINSADYEITYEVVAQELIKAPMDIAERLHVPLETNIIHVARRKLHDNEVISFSERYLLEDVMPSLTRLDLSKVSFLHEMLVDASEYPLLRAEFEIEAHLLTEAEASLVKSDPGQAAIVVNRMTFTAPNRPAVWYRAIFRNEYFLGVRIGQMGYSTESDH